MLKQMLYDANYDKDLLEQRTKAKELCYDFNNLRPSDEKGQKEILKKLLGKTKNNLLSQLHSGVITAITLKLVSTSIRTIIW